MCLLSPETVITFGSANFSSGSSTTWFSITIVLAKTTGVSVTDHALSEARNLAAALAGRASVDVSAADLLESPHIFIGSLASLEEKFIRQREQLGINSIMVGELGLFDALVERLAGT